MILLTGASGFIGGHLLTDLINEYGSDHVLALTSKPINDCPYLLHDNYNFEQDFFLKNNYGNKITTIIHAGAFIPKNSSQANDWKLCNGNILNTQTLLDAVLPNLKKIIYLSSSDVYGKSELISEDTLKDPFSLYGHSKLYIEKMITAWANAENKINQILRIGHVYGPGEEAYQKIIPVTMRKIINGEAVEIWGDGNELRAFIFIDDVVKSILKSLQLDHAIGPVNIVSDKSVSVKALVDKIIKVTGKKVEVKIMPAAVEGRNLIFDNSKMKQHLAPAETPLETGLTKEWLQMQSLML